LRLPVCVYAPIEIKVPKKEASMPSTAAVSERRSRNAILAGLPGEEYERILPRLELVKLPRGRIVNNVGDEARHAYFLLSGVVSLLSVTADGRALEVAVVGSEGFVGVFPFLLANTAPYQVIVQNPGDAMSIKAQTLADAFHRGGRFQELLLRYTHSLLMQTAQSAACNHFHSIEQRLSRRLLISCNYIRADTFDITQESISQMLGAPRSAVSAAASSLKRRGLIRYARGHITVVNRRGLESTACECYQTLVEEVDRLVRV
jgi:CRP-like cAMP-binding protein